ncbi:MAG: hypothetical protein II234_00960 [Clostridia bacterium]|nr:hypothetical protein [Clostridia bacterium]
MKINIRDLGANESGTLQTKIIQKAIDECFLNGGGEVIIPEGNFLTGGIRLRSNVTLHLLENAKLIGSRDPEDYFEHFNDTLEPFEPEVLSKERRASNQGIIVDYDKHGGRWYNALIRAYKAENIKIIGEKGSQIDGMDCYDEMGEEQYRGPHAISLIKCSNVYLSGYEIINSSNWAHCVWYSNNIEINNISVLAGHDGCHFKHCRNIYIHDSNFSTGDDCVAGYNNRNITVENCEFNTACSAFRLGATNALIQKCHAYGPPKHLMRYILSLEDKIAGVHDVPKDNKWNYMLSFYTYFSVSHYTKDNPGNENVIIRDCKIENADRFLHYNFSGNEPWQSGSPLLDIEFKNITAENIRFPITFYADKEKHIEFKMENADITLKEGFEDMPLIHAANFDLISLKNVNVKNAKGEVLIKKWTDDNNIITENVKFSDDYKLSELQTEEFICRAI